MRTIFFILQKEFIQVFRNREMLPIIFLLPVVQLVVLVNAATQELRNINLTVVDQDMSPTSQSLIRAFDHSKYYTIVPVAQSVEKALDEMHNNNSDAVLVIEPDMEKHMEGNQPVKVQLLVNAINGTSASLINKYTSSILSGFFEKEMVVDSRVVAPAIATNVRHWYNPTLNYKYFMVPGILVILVTVVAMFLSALNVVREKELGTIEQINVTPIKRHQFIIGKMIPFWVIAMFELAFGLLLARYAFGLMIEGSLPLLFAFASLFMLVALSAGLILSTSADNQQQVMFMSFFFLLLFILMSGLFTPTDSMPVWAKMINTVNPMYYFMKVIRMIILKGSGMIHIGSSMAVMAVMSLTTVVWAVVRYRKKAD